MIAAAVLYIEDKNQETEGLRLSTTFKLPLVSNYDRDQITLVLTKERLELRVPGKNLKPLFVDFKAKPILQRLCKSKGRSELIAKAVGIKGNFRPTIIDTTAGLGEDAVVLAHLGCFVEMLERSPIVCALLEDGLKREKRDPAPWLNNLTLTFIDAKQFLQNQLMLGLFVDVVYLDPMFPLRLKSALVKKEMRILKQVVGQDEDAKELFMLAKQCARKRVVVKRPKLAGYLTEEQPTVIFSAKTSRFDVYLLNQNPS